MSWAIKHKGLVCKIAFYVYRRAKAAGALIELEDLTQDGYEIAIIAEQKFDPKRGFAESTYLYQCLLRELNTRVNYSIYRAHHEHSDVEPLEGHSDSDLELEMWDFCRSLSPTAQVIFKKWLAPGDNLGREIDLRTVGRRCSLRALFAYLKDQGHDAGRLRNLQDEIFAKVEHCA